MNEAIIVNELKSDYNSLKQRVDAAASDIERKLTWGGGVAASLDITSALQTLKFASLLLEILEAQPDATVPNLIKALRQQLDEAEKELSNSLAKAARDI